MAGENDQIDMSTLTDEEIAAMSEGMSEDEQAALQRLANDKDAGTDDDDDDDAGAAAGEQDAATGAAGAAATVDAGAGSDAPGADQTASPTKQEPEPARRSSAVYTAALPEDYQQRVTDLKTQVEALAKQFSDGDISFDEYRAKQDSLAGERDELLALRVKAELSSEMNSQSAEQQWQNTISEFTRDALKNEKVDYAKDAARMADLDLIVKALASRPENEDKSMRWFLDEAHKRVNAIHGSAAQTQQPTTPQTPTQQPAAKPNRKPPTESAPATLAAVPGGEGPGDVGDEFVELDGLEGDALEAALGKMSSAQREKYLAG